MAASPRAQSAPRLKLSRWQLDLFCKCPRCFWMLKRHQVKPPESYPLALNNVMDALLKAEFDLCRAQGKLHPLLVEAGLPVKLFADVSKLAEWRNNFQGVRWTDPATGHTLFGAVDDILEYADGSLAVLDYKSSGAAAVHVYDSYQLQMDVYTYLLQRLGYRTAPRAFFAFFVAVRNEGFNGRLPFRGTLAEVQPNPERVPPLFAQAIATALADRLPESGPECDVCRWGREALPVVGGPVQSASRVTASAQVPASSPSAARV